MSVLNKLNAGTFWRIVSQVDLAEIRTDVERPFHLLIVSDERHRAAELARLLSDVDGAFIHPWISVQTSPLALDAPIDLAVVLTHAINFAPEIETAHRQIAGKRRPFLVIVGGEAAAEPGAHLPRHGERRRIAVPVFDTESVSTSVAGAILDVADANLRLALGRQLPPLRPALFNRLIQETSQTNATYSFSTGLAEIVPALDIPLNVGDLIVLTKNQLVMAYKIALVAGKEGSPQQLLGEIVSVLGGGFLFRQLARQLVGLIPVWGIVPKVAVAYAGTWSIGQAIVLWAVEGQRITPELLKQFYDEAWARGQQVAQEIATNVRGRLSGDRPHALNTKRSSAQNRESFWQRVRNRLPGS